MRDTAPLIKRQPEQAIAWLNQTLAPVGDLTGAVNAQTFIGHVHALAECLPPKVHCINLCDNRYLFMLSLCAVIVRQQTNLLPSNKNTATQTRLSERYDDCYIIHDGVAELGEGIEPVDLSQLDVHALAQQHGSDFAVPDIELSHIAAITFTSGSTGDAKPNIKTWHTMVASTAINARYMLQTSEQTAYYLATVPGQHMWGFETSVLMPLFENICVADTRPLYPADIFQQLQQLPTPRNLVTTPFHLRSIYLSDQRCAAMDTILIATAPLDYELAANVESKFSATLREIYGCSEVGSMATRLTAHTDHWQRFEGLTFAQDDGNISVTADHLPDSITLEDQLEMIDDEHFKLAGRSNDQINIAGKRGSLQEVNRVLMSFKGLRDGVVLFPPQDRPVPRLAALVVLDEEASKDDLRTHFRRYVDSAFVPRPIMVVDALPREENGKLVQSKLLSFYQGKLKASA